MNKEVEHLGAAGLVAYPTETVWGLAADASSEVAVASLFAWKGRMKRHPVSLLVADVESLFRAGVVLDARARALIDAYWPGPLTIVLSCSARLAPGISTGRGSSVGFRCSSHPVASALAREAAAAGIGLLTATSLNRSGCRPARNRDEAVLLCGGDDAPKVVAQSEPDAGGESPTTVVDVSGSDLVVVREGRIKTSDLQEVTRGVTIS